MPATGPCRGISSSTTRTRSGSGGSRTCGPRTTTISVEPAIGRILAERVRDRDGAVVVSAGVPQPLLAVYRKRVAAIATTMLASGERRAGRLVELARLVEVSEEDVLAVDPSGLSFFDIDTLEAYREALARLDPRASR